jgi:hypothetical protein
VLLGKLKRVPFAEAAAMRYLARPFSRLGRKKVVLAYWNNSLAWAQFYPFLYFARRLELNGYEFRAVAFGDVTSSNLLAEASALFLQSPYEPERDLLEETLSGITTRHPDILVSYFDWSATSDLRFSGRVAPFVSHYVKKSMFRDRSMYLQAPRGHTHLVDFFTARHGLDNPEPSWTVDTSIIDRLRLGPAFSTTHRLLPLFARGRLPARGDRPIDVSGRVETEGTPWYSRMRAEAAAAIQGLGGLTVTTGRLGRRGFMRELRKSKICFSPFGYGEICIRDFEAVAAGAVLLKPDMAHLETDPDIFVPWETYVPVRWDLEDLDCKVRQTLADPQLRRRLAENAFNRVQAHLHNGSLERLLARLCSRD